ncbi:MAG: acyl carrier protein [Acidimicrobiia bacterium]|jgi:acyl carrier protein
MTTHDRIRSFIVDQLQFRGDPADLTDDLPLLEKEVLDSMGIFELVSFLEQEYGVEIDDTELVADNFATIDHVAKMVEAKS